MNIRDFKEVVRKKNGEFLNDRKEKNRIVDEVADAFLKIEVRSEKDIVAAVDALEEMCDNEIYPAVLKRLSYANLLSMFPESRVAH